MNETLFIQGRKVTPEDIRFIQQLMEANPSWLRTRLSKELCAVWNWRNAKGQLKNMACLSLLTKLEKQGYLTLPPSRQRGRKGNEKRAVDYVPHDKSVVSGNLDGVVPLQIKVVESKEELAPF